jgi:hypothetical protein
LVRALKRIPEGLDFCSCCCSIAAKRQRPNACVYKEAHGFRLRSAL